MSAGSRLALAILIASTLSLGGSIAARAASSWGLPGEEVAQFDAEAVDVVCVLTGDCPDDCGGGKRVMGLLRESGELVLAIKNLGPFTGTAHDLVPFCHQTLTVEGLFTINYGVKTFALQFFKPVGGTLRGANGYIGDWAAAHGVEAKDKKARQWFRNDERVRKIIEAQGKLGLKDKGIEP